MHRRPQPDDRRVADLLAQGRARDEARTPSDLFRCGRMEATLSGASCLCCRRRALEPIFSADRALPCGRCALGWLHDRRFGRLTAQPRRARSVPEIVAAQRAQAEADRCILPAKRIPGVNA